MRPIRNLAVAFFVVVAFAGCRQTRPEAGLPPSVFDRLMPRVVSNDRGFWFLVTEAGTAFQPFVSIGEGPNREVFYAIPEGKRTARLLPLTPFAYSLLDTSRDQRVALTWLARPSDAGSDLVDSVGWLETQGGDAVWAGAPLADNTPVVLVDGAPTNATDVAGWLAGTAVWKGGKLTSVRVDEGMSPPFAIIPDGALPARPIRAALANVSAQPIQGVEFSSSVVGIPDAPASRFTTRPAALRAGVDALLSPGSGDNSVVTLARPILRNGLPLSLTSDPFATPAPRAAEALLAMRDIGNGRDLHAAKLLLEIGVQSGDNSRAGMMRTVELVAAAGFVDWTRQTLVNDATGLDADTALYLARAHFVGGDLDRAADFAARAEERFVGWPMPAGRHGGARAVALLAQIAAARGDWETAFAQAIDGAKRFDDAEDAMRAAELELVAASYAMNAGDAVKAVKAAALARSRYFHGNSPYHAAMAELGLADLYLRAGEAGEAAKMVDFAAARFDELGDNVGRNRARIAAGRVASMRSRAQGVRELEAALQTAQTSGDFVGVVDAASSLVALGGVPDDATASYGLVIAGGLARADDPSVRERAAQALALLCSRGMSEAVGRVAGASPRDIAIARSACGAGQSASSQDDRMLAVIVNQGWAAILGGDLATAGALAERAQGAVTESLRTQAPLQAAEALLFAAAVIKQTEDSRARELITQTVQLLGDSIDPVQLATTLSVLADRQLSRGQVWAAADLLRAAGSVAADQGQAEQRREIVMRRVVMLHAAGEYDEALAAIRDAEPVLETAGPAATPLLARASLLLADVQTRLGRPADAGIARAKAAAALVELDPVARVEITLFRAQLALDRGDAVEAATALDQADTLHSALGDGLVAGDARGLVQAKLRMARGDLHALRGQNGAAANSYAEALDALSELVKSEAVLAAMIEAHGGLGRTTSKDENVATTIEGLEQIRGTLTKGAPSLVPLATETLADLEISNGRPSRALDLVSAATLDGGAAASNPVAASCLEARAAALSGRADGVAKLRRCGDLAAGDERVDAMLLAVVSDPAADTADKNRTARQLLAGDGATISPRQRERLTFVSELAAGAGSRNEKTEASLTKALEAARNGDKPSRIAAATEQLVDYFLATGQAPRARSALEENAGAFYDMGAAGPGALARLRATIGVTALDAVGMSSFTQRALIETPDLTSDDQARLLFASAQNAVVLGMWQYARSQAAQAFAAANSARNQKLRRSIEGFAKRFALSI